MSFSIITKNSQQTFNGKKLVEISSSAGYDCVVNTGFDFVLTVQYDEKTNKCFIINQTNCKDLLFKGQPLPQKLIVDKLCKIMVKDSDEFITVKIDTEKIQTSQIQQKTSAENINILQNTIIRTDAQTPVKSHLEQQKVQIENVRAGIVKQIAYSMNDLKHKLSMNSKAGIILHIGLFVATLILAFGVSNYFTGLPLKDSGSMIQMPVNMKFLIAFTIVIYSVGVVLKQGIYLFLQNRRNSSGRANSISEKTLIITSSLFYAGVYLINVVYYLAPGSMPFFAICMSLFFTALCVILAIACGYFKSDSVEISKELSQYEYREDFEKIIHEYRSWIEKYINSLSETKIANIKDKLFSLQIKSVGEIILGILTAPFLAYGVSNTLAACFPDAAGWVRISGLRFSPVFLVLATFLIIFAFFAFVNGFLINKKIQASNVIKNDGFSNYLQHGTDIYGIQGAQKLDTDMRRSFIIGLCIIFIEFSMNISYFMQEIGADLGGILLSAVAALVPTALLIAETFMLSQTKFDTYACEEVLSKYDK